MTAVLSRPISGQPRTAGGPTDRTTPAVGYQRVLHQMVRREFDSLAEVVPWAGADDATRATELARHGELIARVLLQHHETERELLWPALFRNLPEPGAARDVVGEWTGRTAVLDHQLRDLATVARQWIVARSERARDAFAGACAQVARDVAAATIIEERTLLPLLSAHLPPTDWLTVCRAAPTRLSGREQMLVLGLTLEDACALDRARLLVGLCPAARTAWRVVGRRNFRAAVVRLRGAPPAG